jgi:glycosyltransferase involved in cell wall biosynthesis
MYLIPIHVPIYLDGDRELLTTEWRRSLELLRDSLGGRFGQVSVAAPTLPAGTVSIEQRLVPAPSRTDGIELHPGFDARCRARTYWMRERARWHKSLTELTGRAEVVHAMLDDLYRPIAFEGFRVGVQLRKPTVFVQDTDIVVQQRQLSANKRVAARWKAAAYGLAFELVCRWSVGHADLALLKGAALMRRYGLHAKNAKEFQDTSFCREDIVDEEMLGRRLWTLQEPRALRLVYCGRLIERKGVQESLRILARATALGAAVQFDVIGDGPQRRELEAMADSAGIAKCVRFLGSLPYDSALLHRLAQYDALLFTPTAEDTPRMIFDGYAAGLPIVAFDIDYVKERSDQERAAYLLPRGHVEQSAVELVELCRHPHQLFALSRNARSAADFHSAENWYRRRAEWTSEAVERHRRALHR